MRQYYVLILALNNDPWKLLWNMHVILRVFNMIMSLTMQNFSWCCAGFFWIWCTFLTEFFIPIIIIWFSSCFQKLFKGYARYCKNIIFWSIWKIAYIKSFRFIIHLNLIGRKLSSHVNKKLMNKTDVFSIINRFRSLH